MSRMMGPSEVQTVLRGIWYIWNDFNMTESQKARTFDPLSTESLARVVDNATPTDQYSLSPNPFNLWNRFMEDKSYDVWRIDKMGFN